MEQLLTCRTNGVKVLDSAAFYELLHAEIPVDSLKASWLVYGDGFVQSTARRAAKRDAELVPVTISGLEQLGAPDDRDLVAVHEAQARVQAQAGLCERQIKALVALTALPEPELRRQLASGPVPVVDDRAALSVQAVPADVIRQRPDVYRAQRELVAAAESAGAARALLLPNLSLSGSVLRNRYTTASGSTNFNTWSVGPLSLNLPLIGRGALNANADAARARYEAAAVAYAATLRQAVAEVEQSLVTLSDLQQRQAATDAAVSGYVQSFRATEARHRVGLASLPELEDARRLRLNAESSAIALQQERFGAWVALYLALGGGFDPAHSTTDSQSPS